MNLIIFCLGTMMASLWVIAWRLHQIVDLLEAMQ